MAAEVAQHALEQRRALIAEIGSLQKTEEAELKKAGKELAEAEKKLKTAAAEYEKAKQGYTTACQVSARISMNFYREIEKRKFDLQQTASPLLHSFAQEIRSLEDSLRSGVYTVKDGTKRNLVNNQVHRFYLTNAPSTLAALEACKKIRETIEELKLQALSEDEILAQITALRDSIPRLVDTSTHPEAA
jgi:hypothetical protein